MKVSADHSRKDLSTVRTGRANLSLFEDIKVEYYGTLTPPNQLASLGIPDPTLITVQPWDPTLLEPKDKKITEDDKFNGLELLQKIIDDYSKKIEEAVAARSRRRDRSPYRPSPGPD